jgi:hypothetical protein
VHRRDKTLPAAARAFARYLPRRGALTIRRLVPACLRDYWADLE